MKNGLKNGNVRGICVIRSDHELVIEYLIHMMLLTTDEHSFSIIEISPLNHNLKPNELVRDEVVEFTNPLHNYIRRNYLKITQENIIGEHIAKIKGIPDCNEFEQRLDDLNLIQDLDY